MSTYHHGNLRAALLRAGSKLLEKQGVGALSLREAARRAGVSHNAPYRHFPDRESLLAALVVQGFALLDERLRPASGREKGVAYVRFALEHPQLFRLMFGGEIPLDGHPEVREASERAYRALVDSFRAQAAEKEAIVAAAASWSLVHGLALLLLDGHFPRDDSDFVERVLRGVRFTLAAQRSA